MSTGMGGRIRIWLTDTVIATTDKRSSECACVHWHGPQESSSAEAQADATEDQFAGGRFTAGLASLGAGGCHRNNIERDLFRQVQRLGIELLCVVASVLACFERTCMCGVHASIAGAGLAVSRHRHALRAQLLRTRTLSTYLSKPAALMNMQLNR